MYITSALQPAKSEKELKVIQLCRSVYPFHGFGGIEKYPYYLSKHLIAQGIDVEIVASMPDSGKRQEFFEGIKYTFLAPRMTGKKLIGLRQILFNKNAARYLRSQQFDILQCCIPSTFYLMSRGRKPVIMQPFGLEPFTLTAMTDKKGLKKLYLDVTSRQPWKYCFSHAEVVAAEGDFQFEIMEKLGIPQEKIVVFPIGVDILNIEQKLKSKQISRESLGIGKDDFVLVSVNKFIPAKGVNYLVEAFRLVKQECKNCKLILIGGVNNESERTFYQSIIDLIKQCNLEDSVTLLQNLSEESLYGYYRIANVYISPALYDDIIMSIQEAMVAGLPVVSTGQGFLVKDGVNGYVVPKKDPNAMAQAILKVLYNRDKFRMGEESRKLISGYDWKEVARMAIKTYTEMTAK